MNSSLEWRLEMLVLVSDGWSSLICLCSVASTTSRMNSSSPIIRVIFSTILVDSRPAVETSWELCKILSVVGRRRGDWRKECTWYGLFLRVFTFANLQLYVFRYCVPMDDSRPELDLTHLRDFKIICQDKKGTSSCNVINRSRHGNFFKFPW